MSKYSEKIEKDAEKYGYKAANLINLEQLSKEFNINSQIILEVPKFKAISGDEIANFLDLHDNKEWRNIFDKFVVAYQAQSNKKTINDEAAQYLEDLQKHIVKYFENHDLSTSLTETIASISSENKDLMIRSTGKYEDMANMANPGGNESVATTTDLVSIKDGMKQVVASYFTKKSFEQKLLGLIAAKGQAEAINAIKEILLPPVLLQQLVGTDKSSKVSSGVIYSDKNGTMIDAAYGHGEYVVNSKGPVDNYYISPNGLVYSSIVAKPFRIVPVKNQEGKIELVQETNTLTQKFSQSIPDEVASYLSEFAKFLEEKYQQQMDIEFVYNHENNIISIVQARAIPETINRNLASALSPEFLSNYKKSTTKALEVITPKINDCRIVTNDQIIIAENLPQALSKYLDMQDKTNIKAVIVKNPAATTSHEAGLFNNASIICMQVSDIEKAKNILKKDGNLIIDPQHGILASLDKEKFKRMKNTPDAVKSLVEQEIIKNGIFASSLTSHISINSPQALDQIKDKEKLDEIFKILNYGINEEKILIEDKAKEIRDNFDVLKTPLVGTDNENIKNAIANNLRYCHSARKKNYISQELYQKTMIISYDLWQQLEVSNEKDDDFYIKYFNILQKFEGIFLGAGSKGILANSLAMEIRHNKYEKLADELAGEQEISKENKKYLTELLKFDDYFINDKSKENWQKFCTDIALIKLEIEPKPIVVLSDFMNKISSFNIHPKWLNFIFTEKYEEKYPAKTFKSLKEDFEKLDMKPINQAAAIIDNMKSKISSWEEPAKFEESLKLLHDNLSELNKYHNWSNDLTPIAQMIMLEQVSAITEIMDLSIKNLTGSTQYIDIETKGKNFKSMLQEFHGLLKIWAKRTSFRADDRIGRTYWNGHITVPQYGITGEINRMNVFLNNYKSFNNSSFLPSYFLVNKKTLDIVCAQTWRVDTGNPKTLEDMFTLIHQNMIVSVNNLNSNISARIEKQLPKIITTLNDTLEQKLKIEGDKANISTNYNLENKILEITRNIPLRQHSLVLNITYDIKTKKTKVEFSMFGDNESNRFDHIEIDSLINLTNDGFKFTKNVNFHNFLTYEVELEREDQIDNLIKSLNKSIKTTYDLDKDRARHYDQLFLMQNRLDILSKLDEISFNKLIKNPILHKLILQHNRLLKQDKYISVKFNESEINVLNKISLSCNVSKINKMYEDKEYPRFHNDLQKQIREIRINHLNITQEEKDSLLLMLAHNNISKKDERISELDDNVITFLINDRIIGLYEKRYFTVDDLKFFNYKKIEALTSDDISNGYAISGYEKKYFTFNDLKNLDVRQIKALTSSQAFDGYQKGCFTFDDLKDLDVAKIEVLSEYRVQGLLGKYLELDYIKNLDIESIRALTAYYRRWEYYQDQPFTVDKFKNLNAKQIEALTISSALEGYKEKHFTFDQLKDLDAERIRALASDSAVLGYKNGYFTFDQLKDLDAERIRALANKYAIQGYKEKHFIFDDIKNLDIERIEALASDSAVLGYKNGYFTFNNLKDLSVERIKVLTSYFVNEGYKNGYFTFHDLKDLDIERIETLAGCYPNIGYNKKYYTFNQLKDLPVEKIKVLTSDWANHGYQYKHYKFDDLKDLDVGKIEVLTDFNAIKLYGENKDLFDDIKNFSVDEIKSIASSKTTEEAKAKINQFNLQWKARNIGSGISSIVPNNVGNNLNTQTSTQTSNIGIKR